jgi:acetylornithine deacetylase/succinyl-diaminopimelate desuccinylase-like protein
VATLAFLGTRPPAALGPDAPGDQFSAVRAMSHLQHFAVRPHPIGSEAQRRVRDYLVKTLTALGAAVHVEKTTGVHARGRTIYAGTAHNIVATFPGRANRRAVMLVAHYDSVPEGPGAADDGAGLISILETIRALRMARCHGTISLCSSPTAKNRACSAPPGLSPIILIWRHMSVSS